MADAVFRKIEIIGTSNNSIEEAVQNGVRRACETLRHVQWIEVKENRGYVEDGRVKTWQVELEVAFRIED